MNLPDYFTDKMKTFFPEEAEDYFNSFNLPRYFGLRANTLKITPEDLKNLMDIPLEPVIWCDAGFYYDGESFRPGKSPLYHAGLFYIQEPSAMAPASVFEINKGDNVLDLCAAPGGKTTHLAAKLEGEGLIVAADISNTRLRGLIKNIELAGVTNAVVINETAERLANIFPSFFDKILIDAPCSGEGMFRKDSEAIKNYDKHKSEQYTVLQKDILHFANKMLKPGGRIMYSTCTFAPEENEMIIGEFLSSNSNYDILEINHDKFGFSQGYPRFYNNLPELYNTARLWPQKVKGEGHFLACLAKNDGEQPLSYYESENKKVSDSHFQHFRGFCSENLDMDFSNKKFTVHGESLYASPKDIPDLKGIRIMRSGFYLGEFKKNRFEPSQAFAMGIKSENYTDSRRVNLSKEDSLRYLKGESFNVDSTDGYALICVENHPLGFGKVKDGRMKNKYLKSWIMN